MYFFDPQSQTSAKQAVLEPGEQRTTVAYPGHQFYYVKASDPETRLLEFTVKDGKQLYELPDEDPNTRLMKKFAQEQEFREKYKAENGREWLGYYPKGKPVHFMHTATKVGDTFEIPSAAGHFDCDPVIDRSGACKGPQPGNMSITVEVVATSPQAFVVKNFLSTVEADHLVSLGAHDVKRSTTHGEVHKMRTSLNTWIYRETDVVTEQIFKRLADVSGIPLAELHHGGNGAAEAMQLVSQRVGSPSVPPFCPRLRPILTRVPL